MPVQVSLFPGGLGFTEGFLCVGPCRVLANARLHPCPVSVSCGVCVWVHEHADTGDLSSSDVSMSLCICVCLRVGNARGYVCLSR